MIILVSPAKTFNWKRKLPKSAAKTATQPRFLNEASMIARSLRLYSQRGLGDILEVSDSLAELNYKRLKEWDKKHTEDNSRPALYAYYGDVFQELSLDKYDKKEIEYVRESLRIISGLYGYLSGTDVIQPYRAEMKLPIRLGSASSLVQFWKEKITRSLNEDINKGKHELVLNLASKEYAKAVEFSNIEAPVISVDFKQNVKGRIKNYGLLSKRARGHMLDYCITHQCKTIADLKKFNVEGYKLEKETKNTLGFVRAEAPEESED